MSMIPIHEPGRLRRTLCLLTLLLASVALPVLAEVTVSDAWARATPPGARTGALYLTLDNDGEALRLVGAASDVAERTELHTHRHENGMMRMEQVEAIDVPAGGTASLEPHGDHVMLIGLHRGLAPGETVALELEFDDGSRLEIEVPVRDARRP